MFPSMEVIVTCNYCHEAPAAGWLKSVDPETNEEVGRSACHGCATKEGGEMIREVVSHDN